MRLWTAPPVPRPPESLWSMRKSGRQTDCALLGQAEDGWGSSPATARDGDESYASVDYAGWCFGKRKNSGMNLKLWLGARLHHLNPRADPRERRTHARTHAYFDGF